MLRFTKTPLHHQIEGGMAAHDGRLQRDDRILEINCQDMTLGTQEQAAHIIKVFKNVFPNLNHLYCKTLIQTC